MNVGIRNIHFAKYQSRGTFGILSALQGIQSLYGTLAAAHVAFKVFYFVGFPTVQAGNCHC